MKRLENLFTDKRFLTVVILGIFGATASLLFAPGIPTTVLTVALITLGGLMLVVLLYLMLSGAESESMQTAKEITSTPLAQDLVERWLRRSRYYRLIGGLLGFIASFALLDNDAGMRHFLFVMLCGVAIGGALAEVHILHQQRGSSLAADLTVRSLRDFTDPTDLAAMATVTAISSASLVVMALGRNPGGSVAWGLAALLTTAAVLLFQYVVVVRARPALRPELREADDLLRYLAATQGFARPAIAVAFVMAANAIGRRNDGEVVSVISVALIVVGIVWWYRGRHERVPALAQQRTNA